VHDVIEFVLHHAYSGPVIVLKPIQTILVVAYRLMLQWREVRIHCLQGPIERSHVVFEGGGVSASLGPCGNMTIETIESAEVAYLDNNVWLFFLDPLANPLESVLWNVGVIVGITDT